MKKALRGDVNTGRWL